MEDVTKGLPESSSDAKNHYLGSSTAVCDIQDPTDINSDKGIHCTSHEVQEWAAKNDTHWHFHLPYDPTPAGLMERMKGLLNNRDENPLSQQVDQRFTQAL